MSWTIRNPETQAQSFHTSEQILKLVKNVVSPQFAVRNPKSNVNRSKSVSAFRAVPQKSRLKNLVSQSNTQ